MPSFVRVGRGRTTYFISCDLHAAPASILIAEVARLTQVSPTEVRLFFRGSVIRPSSTLAESEVTQNALVLASVKDKETLRWEEPHRVEYPHRLEAEERAKRLPETVLEFLDSLKVQQEPRRAEVPPSA